MSSAALSAEGMLLKLVASELDRETNQTGNDHLSKSIKKETRQKRILGTPHTFPVDQHVFSDMWSRPSENWVHSGPGRLAAGQDSVFVPCCAQIEQVQASD